MNTLFARPTLRFTDTHSQVRSVTFRSDMEVIIGSFGKGKHKMS